jgi:enterochelin esterase-like enzyme
MHLTRRALLTGLAGAAFAPPLGAHGQTQLAGPPEDLDVRDIAVEGDRALGRRLTLFTPRHLGPGERVPLLILLHGLGETGDERMGAYAWVERYGLGTAYDRLRRPPVVRTSRRRDFTDVRLAELGAELSRRPFRGMAIACPFTPNVHKAAHPKAALEGYARWIAEVVIPRARKDAPVHTDAARTALNGCSLGGYIGLEVFLHRADMFGAWGGVQAALGMHRVSGFAERIAAAIAKVGPRALHLLTSEADPFRDQNVSLAAALKKKGVRVDLAILPGPHDQPWLREAGTIEMLLWHDRRWPDAPRPMRQGIVP